jgi:hypothetical protein
MSFWMNNITTMRSQWGDYRILRSYSSRPAHEDRIRLFRSWKRTTLSARGRGRKYARKSSIPSCRRSLCEWTKDGSRERKLYVRPFSSFSDRYSEFCSRIWKWRNILSECCLCYEWIYDESGIREYRIYSQERYITQDSG